VIDYHNARWKPETIRLITYVISLRCFTYGCSFISSNESKRKVTANLEYVDNCFDGARCGLFQATNPLFIRKRRKITQTLGELVTWPRFRWGKDVYSTALLACSVELKSNQF